VVLLSHSGVDTNDMSKGEDDEIARNVSGIDVIVSGHTHTEYPAVLVTNPKTMKPVLIQQAGSYGRLLGKIKVEVAPDGKVTLDTEGAKLMKVDDTIVANDAQVNALVEQTIKDLEGNRVFSGKSFLESTLSRIEGMPITDDAAVVGDLFFRRLGSTTFDIPGLPLFRETPMLDLTADAELAYGLELGLPAQVGVMAAGVIRADLTKGKSGEIAFTDVFRILPLGISPVDGSVGYPVVAFRILPIYLKAALELTAGYAYTSEDASTNFLVPSGMKVEYDTSRPVFNPDPSMALDPANGRITKMYLADDPRDPDGASTLIWDAATGGWKAGYGALGPKSFVVVTSYYIASFAKQNGVTLLDINTSELITPEQAIVKRPDGSEVKEWEALAWFVKRESAANGGTLPARYDKARTQYPRRMICAGPLCKPL
jgi:2',3'-cyclic-nucleotide 2'-phosphodiesterase (5'-nucleotidase family)